MGTVTVIIGGVRSGKTGWAEHEAVSLQHETGGSLVYLASGVAFDREMKERIERHRKDRADENWLTIEQPVDLPEAIRKIPERAIVVWDCVTTWLTNELMRGSEKAQVMHDLCYFIKSVRMQADLYIVSNEVLSEPVFTEGFTSDYQRMIGEVHQVLVKESNCAVEMEAGLALIRKGEMWE
ncbi:bifunctional adenosylcobinamide kinase/adenosylcobinamide-phosphate guanylyltransferase [Jeotgalibacillus haloalkalitolerans]|uniref:Adenosylcobinamide kinase n=1 Tax=Jeotgalibacillus haloalkalitolerans TaxID=3104292 RepID=A0ABU5KJC2_9BACL|nr:bifunctional adenosylcobinamide kinase/adenosylcobinamide-phosphate guanylyltransferase [Jeotgalibacillus sp. HH7-29]MDZ5711193.1 bifunctional adenosylcobinamide kinase/adenosylcobinamide-phosphate guanylyltransferase [Jeotgalibacillus sp. HH7-29]